MPDLQLMKNAALILRTFLVAAFLLIAINIKAQSAGTLDTTFGVGGVASTGINSTDVDDVVIQPDGKIIILGGNTVARFNSNGTLDTGFGAGGYFKPSVPFSIDSIEVQPDGKIILGGGSPSAGFSVFRLSTNGTLDTTFNGSGLVSTQIGTSSRVSSLNVQADGKIVTVGSAILNDSDFALVRYNADGSLDNSFGTNGRVATNINTIDGAIDSIIQSDGKIVAVGNSTDALSNTRQPTIVRYNADGTLDANFGAGGKIIIPTSRNGSAQEIAVQPDGKIIVVGDGFSPVRYNPNGTLDVIFQSSANYAGFSIAIQSDGKILISSLDITPFIFYIDRYNADGTYDMSFGINGRISVSSASGAFSKLAIQSDGKIIAARAESNLILLNRYRSSVALNAVNFVDFNGDGKEDISLYRPSTGTWFTSLNPATNYGAVQFGTSTDKIVPADYDGDGKTDYAVFRPGSGDWFLQRSNAGFIGVHFGLAGDVPAPADFDGDGRTDIVVYRPSNGTWYVLNLMNNAFSAVQFGVSTDKPVAADYDGDGKSDYAVFRPETGVWFMLRSNLGFGTVQFGTATDKPVIGDYDNDNKADQAVYRPSIGTWFVMGSTAGFSATQFGAPDDMPTPADYDGDGKTDFAVFRSSNETWYQMRSTDGFREVRFGVGSDVPVPNAFVR